MGSKCFTFLFLLTSSLSLFASPKVRVELEFYKNNRNELFETKLSQSRGECLKKRVSIRKFKIESYENKKCLSSKFRKASDYANANEEIIVLESFSSTTEEGRVAIAEAIQENPGFYDEINSFDEYSQSLSYRKSLRDAQDLLEADQTIITYIIKLDKETGDFSDQDAIRIDFLSKETGEVKKSFSFNSRSEETWSSGGMTSTSYQIQGPVEIMDLLKGKLEYIKKERILESGEYLENFSN